MNSHIDLRQLRYFIAVAEHRSFTRAARALHISQPPLTRHIQSLEARIGTRLLHRDRSGTALTRAGSHFLAEARRIVDGLEQAAVTTAAIGAGELGSVTVGFTSTALYGALPSIVRAVRSAHPPLHMELKEMTLREQLSALQSGHIDLGIALCVDRERDLHQHTLSKERLVACLPADHRLAASRRPLVVAALADEDFISFPRALAPRLFDNVASVLAASDVAFQVVQEAVQMQTIIGLVSTGIGVAIVPASMRGLERPGIVYRRLSPAPPEIETQAVWTKTNDNPALERVLKTISRR